jgi:hypothetical protein
MGGISLGKFFVRQGASNGPEDLLPAIPPTMFNGNPTVQMRFNVSNRVKLK